MVVDSPSRRRPGPATCQRRASRRGACRPPPTAPSACLRAVRGRLQPEKARVAATMFPPADGAPLALARRFLPSEACDSGGFFVAIFERSAGGDPPAVPRGHACRCRRRRRRPRRPTKRATGAAACGTNNFARRGRCFSCKRRPSARHWCPPSRPPPLLARFGGDTSILDAFCDAYGLSAATGFPVESAVPPQAAEAAPCL